MTMPQGQDGYLLVSSLPPSQQLPAAPFLIGAYVFIWIALLGYVWSISRRLGAVHQEMQQLETRILNCQNRNQSVPFASTHVPK
jgi:CcmD family protein